MPKKVSLLPKIDALSDADDLYVHDASAGTPQSARRIQASQIATYIQNNTTVENVQQVITNFTAGEAISAGNIVAFKSDGKVHNAQADATIAEALIIGVATETKIADQNIAVLLHGVDTNQSGLTAGTHYYLDVTEGGITSTAPSNAGDVIVRAGVATSATGILFSPQIIGVLS